MPTIKIVRPYDSAKILFECEVTEDQQVNGTAMRHALEKATAARADLRGADLYGANLYGANLYGANLRDADLRDADLRDADLRGADLRDADLRDADLRGANLYGADLRDADLRDADLRGADLRDADLYGKKLVGLRPIIQIGPIGSRSDTLAAFITDGGVMVRAGCFFGTLKDFSAAVQKTHGDNNHGKEYAIAILMIESHAALWTREAA